MPRSLTRMLVHSVLVVGTACLLLSLSYSRKAKSGLLEYEQKVSQATVVEQRWLWKVTELQLQLDNSPDESITLRDETRTSLEEAEKHLAEARETLQAIQSLDHEGRKYTTRAEALLRVGLALVIFYTVALVWRSIRPKKRHRTF